MMPRRRKQTSSTNTTPSTSFQAAPRSSASCRKSCRNSQTAAPTSGPNRVARPPSRALYRVPHGVLHERVGDHDEVAAEPRADQHHRGGPEVRARRELLLAEEKEAEERGLREEREHPL